MTEFKNKDENILCTAPESCDIFNLTLDSFYKIISDEFSYLKRDNKLIWQSLKPAIFNFPENNLFIGELFDNTFNLRTIKYKNLIQIMPLWVKLYVYNVTLNNINGNDYQTRIAILIQHMCNSMGLDGKLHRKNLKSINLEEYFSFLMRLIDEVSFIYIYTMIAGSLIPFNYLFSDDDKITSLGDVEVKKILSFRESVQSVRNFPHYNEFIKLTDQLKRQFEVGFFPCTEGYLV